MTKKAIWPAICLVAIGAILIFSGCGQSGKVVYQYSGEAAKNILFNRPWLDEFPQKPEQRFMAYVFSDEGIGVHDKADSSFRHLLEIFTFRATPEKIFFLFPHDKRKVESTYKVERLQGGGQFNLKLTISQDPQIGGKAYKYFSNTQWNLSEKNTLPAEVQVFESQLH